MKENQISDFTLERYLLNELPPVEMDEIRKSIERDPALLKRIESIQKSNQEILASLKPEDFLKSLQGKFQTGNDQKYKRKKSFAKTFFDFKNPLLSFGSALFVVLLFSFTFFTINRNNENNQAAHYSERIKGQENQIYIYRKSREKIEELESGSMAFKKDLIQVGYRISRDFQGLIFSLDGRGNTTIHLSGANGQSAILKHGKKYFLDNSYELDDAPGFETFFLVLSPSPFDTHEAIKNILEKAKLNSKGMALSNHFEVDNDKLVFNLTLVKGN